MRINLARLDLVTIRLAVLCAETGSLSAAVRRACCSVSAGSQRLSALESALGKSLFVRDHRGVRLTPSGRVFVQHARAILDRVDLMESQIGADSADLEPIGGVTQAS